MDMANLTPGRFEDAQSYALARNAFEVAMRRGWGVKRWRNPAGWSVDSDDISDKYTIREAYIRSEAFSAHADPFTALVAADEWYRENVETRS